MNNGVRTGIFLCECGKAVGDRIDMAELKDQLKGESVASIQSHPQYCLSAGLAELVETVETQGLNRVLLGACSDRIMKKKFSTALKDFGFLESQIELVNLKDHVALVHDEPKTALTRKAAALLSGGIASLEHLELQSPAQVRLQGPVLIMGGGISGFEAARKLARNHVESILFSDAGNTDEILATLPVKYPGSRLYFGEMETLLNDVFANPLVTFMPSRSVEYIDGHVGNYRLGLKQPDGSIQETAGCVVIMALDRKFIPGKDGYAGSDGNVIDQLEFEDLLARESVPSGRIVFWVNGRNANGQGVQELSALAAWHNSRFLAERYKAAPVVLYPDDIRLPLTGADLIEARSKGIEFQTYNPNIRPVVHSGLLNFVNPQDHISHEIKWDTLVVSSTLGPLTVEAWDLMRYLPVYSDEARLKSSPMKVKPEQEPVKWTILAGSAVEPCSLNEALQQGKRAARKVLSIRRKTRDGELAAPLLSVTVDQELCEGCGLCREICPCGAVENVRPGTAPVARQVDPHSCAGCGTCVAACPYGAMKLQNNSNQQLEARVRAIISRMEKTDVLGFACSWGGQGAAELAAARKLTYPSKLFMVPVRCLGTIDPTILSMAFLNGANFIMLAGCPPTSSCHFGYGVDHTWFRVNLIKKLMSMSGLESERISLGYVDVNEPEAFVGMVNSFLDVADRIGPIDRNEERRKRLLAAHATLNMPRMRWVLGACLRRPSELEIPEDHFDGVSFDEVVESVLREEFMASRIVAVLRDGVLNPPEIASALGERAEKVSPILLDLEKDGRVVIREWKNRYPLYALSAPM